MKHVVRSISGAGYRHAVKPLLFRRAPDLVHDDILRIGSRVQNTLFVKDLPRLWSHQGTSLQQTIAGVRFTNPVGLAAGFDKNIEIAPLVKSLGFGFTTGGSVTARPCKGNAKPWFHRLPKDKSLVVHAGLPNKGVESIAQRIETYPQSTFQNFPLIVSVAKTNDETSADEAEAIEDYCLSLQRLEKTMVISMYEINISCPNTHGGEPFTTPEKLERLLVRIDTLQLTRPIVIKMPISLTWEKTARLLDVIIKHRIVGVTIGNLQKDRSQVQLHGELTDDTPGGLSGLPTQKRSTMYIRKAHQGYGDKLIIIGAGGIFSADDAYEKIRAGASLVELITGMIYEGPQVIGDINSNLEKLLQKDGFTSVADAVGVDAPRRQH